MTLEDWLIIWMIVKAALFGMVIASGIVLENYLVIGAGGIGFLACLLGGIHLLELKRKG